jgi:hypothetical protein
MHTIRSWSIGRDFAYAAVMVCGVAASMLAREASATILTGSATIARCSSPSSAATSCTDTGYLSRTVANLDTDFIGGSFSNGSPATSSFTTAFDNWNVANGDLWTLVDGGTLNVTLNVEVGLSIGTAGGGLNPVIVTLSNYQQAAGGPSLSQLVWTQALYVNYTPTAGDLASPIATLDTYSLSEGSSGSGGAFLTSCAAIPGQSPGADNTTPATIAATPSGKAYCDPIYPFQYASEYAGDSLDGVTLSADFFYDAPQGDWVDDSFRGISLLSTVTFETDSSGNIIDRILTVYQGVDYGFTLSANTVPESVVGGLLMAPMGFLLRARRRARARGG